MEFNVDGSEDNSYIQYYINDTNQGIAFSAKEIDINNNVTYRLAISLANRCDQMCQHQQMTFSLQLSQKAFLQVHTLTTMTQPYVEYHSEI